MSLSHARRLSPLGLLGPLIFLAGVILVSWSERDFMAELGWDQWPSGTALGPNGWATVLTFFLTGLCQIGFGSALLVQAGESRVRKLGAGLLVLSGIGMTALSFKTDAEGTDSTWHGQLHVIAYFTFFLSLLLAYVFLGWGSWRRFDASSWKYAPLASCRCWAPSCSPTVSTRATTSSSRFCSSRCSCSRSVSLPREAGRPLAHRSPTEKPVDPSLLG